MSASDSSQRRGTQARAPAPRYSPIHACILVSLNKPCHGRTERNSIHPCMHATSGPPHADHPHAPPRTARATNQPRSHVTRTPSSAHLRTPGPLRPPSATCVALRGGFHTQSISCRNLPHLAIRCALSCCRCRWSIRRVRVQGLLLSTLHAMACALLAAGDVQGAERAGWIAFPPGLLRVVPSVAAAGVRVVGREGVHQAVQVVRRGAHQRHAARGIAQRGQPRPARAMGRGRGWGAVHHE